MKLNKNVEDVLERYEKYVKPDFEKYVKRYKKFADIIIPYISYKFLSLLKINIKIEIMEGIL